MISSQFNFQIISLDTVLSTNIYALDLIRQEKVEEGTVIWSHFQEKGKGQRDNSWYSTPYNNLMFSLILEPKIEVNNQFLLSQKITLAIIKYLDSMSVAKTSIKWPNDILIQDKKVGGMLIENVIQGTKIYKSVVGIGININEMEFPSFSREATSLRLTLGKPLIVEQVLHGLLYAIKEELESGENIQERYLKRLYGCGDKLQYEDTDGPFEGVIVGVLPEGALQVNKEGTLKTYWHKEIKFLT